MFLIVETLLSRLNMSAIKYRTLLEEESDVVHQAIYDRNVDDLFTLVKSNPDNFDANVFDQYGWTYLMHACHMRCSECTELLLKCNANVNLTNAVDKVTPLHIAFAGGNSELAARLLLCGADAQAEMIHENSVTEGTLLKVKPHDLQDPSFTKRVVFEYRDLQEEEPQLEFQSKWKNTDASCVLGQPNTDIEVSDPYHCPLPLEPKNITLNSTEAMKELLDLSNPDIIPLGVNLKSLIKGGMLNPPSITQ